MLDRNDPLPATPDRTAAGGPWGAWATIGWTLLAVIASTLLTAAVAIGLTKWGLFDAQSMLRTRSGDPFGWGLVILLSGGIVATLAIAARWSGESAMTYLALVRPHGRYVLLGLASIVLGFLIKFAHGAEFDIRYFFHPHGFDRAHAANGLLVYLLWIAIIAPLAEEIVFRGFLYRGLAASPLGVVGTIALTSVAFALVHIDKTPAALVDSALVGIIWGWLRYHTRSTWVPIACHAANNGLLSLLILANLFGWFGLNFWR